MGLSKVSNPDVRGNVKYKNIKIPLSIKKLLFRII